MYRLPTNAALPPVIRSAKDSAFRLPPQRRESLVREVCHLLNELDRCSGGGSALGQAASSRVKKKLRLLAAPLWEEGIPDE